MDVEIICSEAHFVLTIILYLLLYQQISGIKIKKSYYIIFPIFF